MFRTVIDCQEGVFSVYKDAAAKEQGNPINYEVILLPTIQAPYKDNEPELFTNPKVRLRRINFFFIPCGRYGRFYDVTAQPKKVHQ